MSDWLTYDDKRFCTIDIDNISGQKGLGIYRFILNIKFLWDELTPETAITLDRMAVNLYARDKSGGTHYLGRLEHQSHNFPKIINSKSYNSENVQFEMELTSSRIEAIEELRQGKNINLEISLEGIAFKQGVDEPRRAHVSIRHCIKQSEWLEVIEQMKYQKTMVIEIPLFEESAIPGAKDINEHLMAAKNHMLHGNYREAVGSCRDVLEKLGDSLGDDKTTLIDEMSAKEYFNKSDKMNKNERLRLVRRSVRFFSQPSRHVDEVSSKYNWNYIDARAMISFTSAIVQIINNMDK